MEIKDVCRLCGGGSGILINIFQSTPECLAKIEAVVPDVVILRNDSLSKVICHRCSAKVKEFFEFKVKCIQTQKKLKKALPWMSSSILNGNKILFSRPASPTVTYMGGPLAFPYETHDPDVEVLTLSDDEEKAGATVSPTPHSRAPIVSQQEKKVPVGRVQPSSQALQQTPLLPNQPLSFSQPGTSSVQKTTFCPGLSSKSTVGVTITPMLPSLDKQQKVLQHSTNATPYPCPPSLACSSEIVKTNVQLCPQSDSKSNDKSITHDVPKSISHLRERPSTYSTSKTAGSSTSSDEGTSKTSEKHVKQRISFHPSVPLETKRNFSSASQNERDPFSSSQESESVISSHSSFRGDVKNIRKTPYEKPKPLCKKHLTESDIKRVCAKYPNVDPVRINEKHIIFPCRLCNKILMTEEAISTHTCVAIETNATETVKLSADDQMMSKLINQNEDSNDSTSSVELIISDDDNDSNRLPAPKHLCNICGLPFHNFARLQKHQLSHSMAVPLS
ncbi:Transcription factor grauzone [Frankliniella fusca]|uniref:Transcription factor grauzone n=1 Tax=Frankliniella fusca TaxID=407009 RepID=A0AAE1HL04_9NEOP|nr:Transcription factor grauzone [Frankliniella fusca]